jgi:hypothetical protein
VTWTSNSEGGCGADVAGAALRNLSAVSGHNQRVFERVSHTPRWLRGRPSIDAANAAGFCRVLLFWVIDCRVNAQPAADGRPRVALLPSRGDRRNEASINRNGRVLRHTPSPRHAENVECGGKAFSPCCCVDEGMIVLTVKVGMRPVEWTDTLLLRPVKRAKLRAWRDACFGGNRSTYHNGGGTALTPNFPIPG